MVPLCPLRTSSRPFTYITEPTIPNVNNIVVSSTREKLAISSPFKSANFSSMPQEFHYFMTGNPNIVMPNTAVTTTRAQDVLVPRKRRNLTLVAAHSAQLLTRLDIP
jgi:hypothetical protein